MINTLSKVLKVITSILTACLFILAMLLVGVRVFGIKIYIVLSGSMEPVFQTGSVVYVKTVDPDELQVDDIITYKLDNVTVTHRIIELVKDENNSDVIGFRTKGDANQAADNGMVLKENVIGEAVSAIPKLGFLAD